jgi:hypothetical protein
VIPRIVPEFTLREQLALVVLFCLGRLTLFAVLAAAWSLYL